MASGNKRNVNVAIDKWLSSTGAQLRNVNVRRPLGFTKLIRFQSNAISPSIDKR